MILFGKKLKLIEGLERENKELKEKVKEYEDDSGLAELRELKKLADECGINRYGTEYQTLMHRAFMSVAGRKNEVIAAYSKTVFLKDNPEEILKRAKAMIKEASVLTAQIEDKTDKKK